MSVGKSRITPCATNVVIKFAEVAEETIGGIIIASQQPDATVQATVVNVGTAVKHITEGDTVLVHNGVGVEIKLEGENLSLVEEIEILAIINQ